MNNPKSDTGRPVRRVGLIDQVAARFQEEIATDQKLTALGESSANAKGSMKKAS